MDESSDPSEWSIAKRRRVEWSLDPDSSAVASHHDQVAFKRYRAIQAEMSEFPLTVKKSGGDPKREAARKLEIEQTQLLKAAVEKKWADEDWGSQNFRGGA